MGVRYTGVVFNSFILLVLLLSVSFSAICYAAEENKAIAKLSLVKNNVEVRYKNSSWHTGQSGELLGVGDQVRTKQGGVAEITFMNTGSKLRLVNIAQTTLVNTANDVKLDFGKLFISVVKGKGGMIIKSPVAVAGVLGTVGILEYDPDANSFDVTNIDGVFKVSDNNNNSIKLTVGKKIHVTSAGIGAEVVLSSKEIMDLIKSEPDGLAPDFIKTGLPPENIKGTTIELNTSVSGENIQINLNTLDIQIIRINATPASDANQTAPNIASINDVINNVATVATVMGEINKLRGLVPVTVF